MLIECSACGAQAKIPDDKEGAKVRCSACAHVYVARRPGARGGQKKDDPTKYFIIGGAVIVGGLVLMMTRGGDEPPPTPPAEEQVTVARPAVVDEMGWDSPTAKVTRDAHSAAVAQNRPKLLELLEPEAAYADWLVRELESDAAAIAEAEEFNKDLGEGVEAVPVPEARAIPPWAELGLAERNIFVAGLIDGMLLADPENLLTAWSPFMGAVKSLTDTRAVVHLQLSRREGDDGTNRTIEWRLVNVAPAGSEARWRVAGWSRFFSPEELAGMRKKKYKKTTKRTLEDGSFVIEGEIRVIPFDPTVPQAERDRLKALVAKLMDLSARPKVRTEAQRDLAAAGKPAIAPLLTAIANTLPIDSEDKAIQLGLVHVVLSDMTGYITTYKPDVSLGTTEERMDSGLKQWFGWYDRKYLKYDGKPSNVGEDPEWEPRDEMERRQLERDRR